MQSGELLEGGSMSLVWRVGDTIRRESGPWTPRVHQLLEHLHASGITYVPKPLGMDSEGREILTYLPGVVGSSPLSEAQRGDLVLVQAARMLRAIHDATTDIAAKWHSGWRVATREPVEVICHGDFAPYNLVFVADEPLGVIDFDFAHAGPRLWDLGYALYRFVPLADSKSTEGFGTPAEQARRMRLFCTAYGLPATPAVIDAVLDRLQFLIDFLLEGQTLGDPRRIANIQAGHLAMYQHDLAYIKQNRPFFEASAT